MSTFKFERVDTRRPCISKDGKKCFFHCWSHVSEIVQPSILKGGHSGGVISGTLAILEFEGGYIKKVAPENFYFIDGGGFEDCDWTYDEVSKEEPKPTKNCWRNSCKHYSLGTCRLGYVLSQRENCSFYE